MLSDGAYTTIGTTIGVVVSAFLTYMAVRYQYSKKSRSPAEILFDAYETALKDYQIREEMRQKQLNEAWITINTLQLDLDKARDIIKSQQAEIDRSRLSTEELMKELAKFKADYEKVYAHNLVKAVKEGRIE